MKKTFAAVLTFIFLICTALTSLAAPDGAPVASVKDAANDVVNVTGKIDATEFVTLTILNPEKAEADIDFSDSEALADAVQYIGSYWAEGGKYSFDVQMHGTSGGVYTIIVTAGNEKYDDTPVTIEYYFSNEKKDIITDINDETDVDDMVDLLQGTDDTNGAYVLYSLGEDKVYTDGDIEEIAKVIIKAIEENGDFDETDVNAFSTALKNSGIIAAYNAHLTDIVLTDEMIKYAAELGLDGTDAYDDYLNMLSDDGRDELHDDLINDGNTYYTTEEIVAEFTELIAYYGIVAHSEAGYGHIDHYFERYEEIYEEAGFKLSKLEAGKKNSVYKALIKKDTDNLDDLKTAFNRLVEDDDDNKGGGGSGSSGGSYSPSTPVTPPVDMNYIAPTSFFLDIDTVPWAEEAIIDLADRDIISGRGNNNFAPNDYVTRAEYLKMLLGALGLVDESTDIPFGDIADDHWARTYIASAVSQGIANGMTEFEFVPEGLVTREQAAAFAARAMEKSGVALEADTNAFADNDTVGEWAKPAVNSLKKAGILTGSGDNMFNPKNNLTRAEAAKIIHGIMSSMGLIEDSAE